MKEGTSGTRQHHTETWTGFRTDMEKAQPGSDLGFFFFGEEMDNLVSLNITHGALAIASASQHPERALMVYDLLRNDPEIYRLMMYGIEGEMYTHDENLATWCGPRASSRQWTAWTSTSGAAATTTSACATPPATGKPSTSCMPAMTRSPSAIPMARLCSI